MLPFSLQKWSNKTSFYISIFCSEFVSDTRSLFWTNRTELCHIGCIIHEKLQSVLIFVSWMSGWLGSKNPGVNKELHFIPNISWTIDTKFCMQIPCGRGSVLLWWRCATLCTSGCIDDVMFGRSGPYACTHSASLQSTAHIAALQDRGGVWCLWMLVSNAIVNNAYSSLMLCQLLGVSEVILHLTELLPRRRSFCICYKVVDATCGCFCDLQQALHSSLVIQCARWVCQPDTRHQTFNCLIHTAQLAALVYCTCYFIVTLSSDPVKLKLQRLHMTQTRSCSHWSQLLPVVNSSIIVSTRWSQRAGLVQLVCLYWTKSSYIICEWKCFLLRSVWTYLTNDLALHCLHKMLTAHWI